MNKYKSKKHGTVSVFKSEKKVIHTPDGDEHSREDGTIIIPVGIELPRAGSVEAKLKADLKPLPMSTPPPKKIIV